MSNQKLRGWQEAGLTSALPKFSVVTHPSACSSSAKTQCGDAPIHKKEVCRRHMPDIFLDATWWSVHLFEVGLASGSKQGHPALLAQSSLTSLAYSCRFMWCRRDMQALTRARWL